MEQGTGRAPRTSRPATASVVVRTSQGSFTAIFNDTPIARAIFAKLPITSMAQRWGDEIYFDVPVKLANTKPTREVAVGDLAYWPDGPCLCIFFGKTPASKGNEPRPASAVTVVGRTHAAPSLLRAVAEGDTITLPQV